MKNVIKNYLYVISLLCFSSMFSQKAKECISCSELSIEFNNHNNSWNIQNNTSRRIAVSIYCQLSEDKWYCENGFGFGQFIDSNAERTISIATDQQIKKYIVYFCYDTNEGCIFPTEQEVQAKHGNNNQKTYYWGYCVAEDKKTGTVFVSQPFKYNIATQETPVAGNEGPIMRAFKKHFIQILKDNNSLGISYENVSFWFDNYCRT